MHRIARADLEAVVYVAIATAPPSIKRGMKSKLPHEAQKARSALAKMICDRIDNDSAMVIVTELISVAEKRFRGKWGIDEPVPATVPQPPPPPTFHQQADGALKSASPPPTFHQQADGALKSASPPPTFHQQADGALKSASPPPAAGDWKL